ncbi:hypothetical protein GCM10009760_18200 [Kitasatospora kazusensis]|uniref:FXSXX-COOH protein n=1 Tax=Kitasatospora kazusensis TaxID=407974 RepID=A0ABP5KUC9_9ACTN
MPSAVTTTPVAETAPARAYDSRRVAIITSMLTPAIEKASRPSSPAKVKATVPGAAKIRRYEANTGAPEG